MEYNFQDVEKPLSEREMSSLNEYLIRNQEFLGKELARINEFLVPINVVIREPREVLLSEYQAFAISRENQENADKIYVGLIK